MNLVTPAPRATLFWRLAVLRRGIERTRCEIQSLRQDAATIEDEGVSDLMAQLSESAKFLQSAADYLKPEAEHPDLDLQTMRPVVQEERP